MPDPTISPVLLCYVDIGEGTAPCQLFLPSVNLIVADQGDNTISDKLRHVVCLGNRTFKVPAQEDEENPLEEDNFDEEDYEPWPRDVAIDATKQKLLQFFDDNTEGVYYDQQLRVLFEERPYKVFQWITGKALTELREERRLNSILLEIWTGNEIAQELISLPGVPLSSVFSGTPARASGAAQPSEY
jgi:hypothetical protein